MPRVVWIIAGGVAGLVALLLIGVAIAIATVDPNRFVAPLAARVKASTGRDLSVKGPVDIKLSLTPRVVLPNVAFANAPWSKTPQMFTAKEIDAQIALLPLLSRRFEVVQFTLVEPVIALETDASGRGNWEFDAAHVAAAAGAATQGSPAAFGIGNFEIRDGSLTYRNGASGGVTSAVIERMALRARDMHSPVAVDFRGSVDGVPVALGGDLGAPDKWLRQQWPFPIALKGEVGGNAVKLDTKLARAGTTTTLGELDAAFGKVAAKGSVKIESAAGRTHYVIDLDVPRLAMNELPAIAPAKAGANAAAKTAANAPASAPAKTAANATAAAPAKSPSDRDWIIPDSPLPIAPFAAIDGEGSVAIGELVLRDGARIGKVGTRFSARDANLDARFDAGAIFGGSAQGQLQFDGRRAESPAVHLVLDAQNLELSALSAIAGIKRDIRGGRVRASVDVRGQGMTPHRVASTMSGTISVVSGPATLGRSAVQAESALAQLANALDPLSNVDAATELRCAVFRLPVADGIAHVDRSIAIETTKLSASASGTLNFRDETLDLAVKPQIRQGVKVDLSQLASLVRVRGRFDKPTVGIDAAESAKTIAELGVLGASGGGIAAIGRALIAPTTDASSPCAVAMGGSAQEATSPSSAQKAPPATRPPAQGAPDLGLPKDVGKALGKLLGR
ncbi:MAG TPA: AsmA family protein [Casimicrobiaceae bacterium]|nr:AsmA family protein [Casimicrobiaceae bacterium]